MTWRFNDLPNETGVNKIKTSFENKNWEKTLNMSNDVPQAKNSFVQSQGRTPHALFLATAKDQSANKKYTKERVFWIYIFFL